MNDHFVPRALLVIAFAMMLAIAINPAASQVGPPGPGLGLGLGLGLGGGHSVTSPLGVGITSVTINRGSVISRITINRGSVISRITGRSITDAQRISRTRSLSVAIGAYSANSISGRGAGFGIPGP